MAIRRSSCRIRVEIVTMTPTQFDEMSSHDGQEFIFVLDGEISVNNANAAEALEIAAAWVDTISPPGVLGYREEEARGVWQLGNSVFMRNWPYAWSLAQSEDSPVKDKVGVARLPRGGDGGQHTATLGGWQLAVSRYSQYPALAADLVRYLTSPAEQNRRASLRSSNPIARSR